MSEKASPLDLAAPLIEQSQHIEKQLKTLQKLLREITESAHDLRKVKQKFDLLGKVDLSTAPLQTSLAEFSAQIPTWVAQEERTRPMRIGREIRDAAAAQEIHCEPLTSDPPMLGLGIFTVELQHSRGTARFEYARNLVAECPLDANEVLQTYSRCLADFDTPFEPESFLEKVFRAYRRRLEMAHLPAGERVELVDILPELTMLMQTEAFGREPSKENFRTYGKVRFAYDLARLRRSGKLDYKGFRLTLGSATVGTTRDKSRVLYLQEGLKGQYFLTIWFAGTNK